MTISCFKNCGEACQKRIGSFVLALLGIMSVAAIFLVVLTF